MNNQAGVVVTEELVQKASGYITAAKADNTKKAYGSDWMHFEEWCESKGLQSLPAGPETICLYIADLAEKYKISTIRRRLATIATAHRAKDVPSPTGDYRVVAVVQGIARTTRQRTEKKKALQVDDVSSMIDTIDTKTLIGKRDKALLLVGFASASRRSELEVLNVEDIEWTAQGIILHLWLEKTQELVEKAIVAVGGAYCPVTALRDWLEASLIKEGAVFRSIKKGGTIAERITGHSIARVVKKVAEVAGLDPKRYAGHSLRSGLATSAAQAGYNESAIKRQGAWKRSDTMHRYVQSGNLFKNNASEILQQV